MAYRQHIPKTIFPMPRIIGTPAFCTLLLLVVATASLLPRMAAAAPDGRGLQRLQVESKTSQNKVALVIGNSDYATVTPKLNNPVHDADDMANALESLGFRVLLLHDGSLGDMKAKVAEFGDMLKHAQVGLVYFAGHGLQTGGINFLVPVDARLTAAADIANETLSAQEISDRMDKSNTSLNIVILDACRDNPVRSATVARNALLQGLAEPSNLRGGFFAFATAQGKVAADGLGRNGLFTSHLLKLIGQPGLDLGALFNQVGIAVKTDTDNQQEPWVSHSPLEPFCFAGCNPPEIVQPIPEQQTIHQITISVKKNK